MKKNLVIVLALLVVCAASFSCKPHGKCASYQKSARIKSDKPFVDKTEKNS